MCTPLFGYCVSIHFFVLARPEDSGKTHVWKLGQVICGRVLGAVSVTMLDTLSKLMDTCGTPFVFDAILR
jgi:hypothetical protein